MDIGTLTGQVSLQDQFTDKLHEIGQEVVKFASALGPEVETAVLGVTALAAAFVGLAITIEETTKKIIEMAAEGDKIIGVENAFNNLAKAAGNSGEEIVKGLGEGVRSTIDDFALMQSTSKLVASGMKLNEDQARTLGAAARELGKSMGTDATGGLNTISMALTTGRTRALAMQGVVVDVKKGEDEFAKSLGTTANKLDAAGQLEGKRIAILDALKERLNKTGESELSFSEKIAQGQAAMSDWYDSLVKAIAKSPELARAIDIVAAGVKSIFGAENKAAMDLLLKGIDLFAKGIAFLAPYVVDGMKMISYSVIGTANVFFELSNAILEVAKTVGTWVQKSADTLMPYLKALQLAGGATGSLAGAAADALGAGAKNAAVDVQTLTILIKENSAAQLAFNVQAAKVIDNLDTAKQKMTDAAAAADKAAFATSRLGVSIKELQDATPQGRASAIADLNANVMALAQGGNFTTTNVKQVAAALNDMHLKAKDLPAALANIQKAAAIMNPEVAKSGETFLKTSDATAEYAKKLAELVKSLTSKEAVNNANLYADALKKIGDWSKLSAQQQTQIAKVMDEAVKSYQVAGVEIPRNIHLIDMAIHALIASNADLKDFYQQQHEDQQAAMQGLTQFATKVPVAQWATGKPGAGNAIEGTNLAPIQGKDLQSIGTQLSGQNLSSLVDWTKVKAGSQVALDEMAAKATATFNEVAKAGSGASQQLIQQSYEAMIAAQNAAKGYKQSWLGAFSAIAQGFSQLSQMTSNAKASQALGNAGGIASGLMQANAANAAANQGKGGGTLGIANDLFDKSASSSARWASGLQSGFAVVGGAMQVWSDTATATTKTQGALMGAMSGAKAGAAFGPYGAAVGAAAGAIMGMVHSLTIGRRTVEDFATSLGGFDALHAQLTKTGALGEQMWVQLTQGTGKGNAAQAAANIQKTKDVLDFSSTYGSMDTVHDKLIAMGQAGIDLWDALSKGEAGSDPAAAKKALDNIGTALDADAKKTDEFNTSLGGMLQQLQTMGGQIPGDLQGMLDTLASGKKLTQDNLDLISQMASGGAPNWKTVADAVERYGGNIEKLPGSFQGARMHDQWQTIIDDMDTFDKAGVSAGDALGLTGDKINDLVNQSIKFGTEIPANAKPWIDSLAEQGKLLDENGNKITDTSKLKFGKDLQTSIQDLIDKIGDLIKKFDDVPGAIDKIPKQTDVTVTTHEKTVKEGDQSDSTAETPAYATGGHVSGARKAIVGDAPEYITPDVAIPKLAMEISSNMPDVRGSAGGGTAIVQLDKRTLLEVLVPGIPGVVQQYGLG